MSKYAKDLLERVVWTAVQAGVGVAAAEVAGVDAWWGVAAATALAVVKGWVAKHVGNSESASLTKSV